MKASTAGIAAALIATVVLSILMVIKAAIGLLPGLDVITMLAAIAGLPKAAGWVMHVVIGVLIYGLVFAAAYQKLPGGPAVKGMAFAVVGWVHMMVAVMPVGGAGFFGLGIGAAAPVATLVLHLIYGAVLGISYDRLVADPRATSLDRSTMSQAR